MNRAMKKQQKKQKKALRSAASKISAKSIDLGDDVKSGARSAASSLADNAAHFADSAAQRLESTPRMTRRRRLGKIRVALASAALGALAAYVVGRAIASPSV